MQLFDFLQEIVDRHLLLYEMEIRDKIEGAIDGDLNDEYPKNRFDEIYDSHLGEFRYLNQESLLLKIQSKLEKEDMVVVTGFIPRKTVELPTCGYF